MRTEEARVFEEPCPYLPDRTSRGEYIVGPGAFDAYETLIPLGWRRSGPVLYRYRCAGCSLCIPLRIPAARLAQGKTASRLARVNADISVSLSSRGEIGDEHFRLYEKYVNARHGVGLHPASEEIEAMLGAPMAVVSEYRDPRGTLLAMGFLDILQDGLSSVYFAFDPDEGKRSLGTYSVYLESGIARSIGKSWYYLGFWVPNSPKMDYKANFRPFQLARAPNATDAPRWIEFARKSEAFAALSIAPHR